MLAVATSSCSSEQLSGLAPGQVSAWKCEPLPADRDKYVFVPYNVFVATPGDIVGASMNDSGGSTVILKSFDAQQAPADWIVSDTISYKALENGGFAFEGFAKNYNGRSYKQALSLDPVAGKLRVQSDQTTSFLKCNRIGNWEGALANVTSGPGRDYIKKRLSKVAFFRPKLGTNDFNAGLAREAYARNDYLSAYHLLAPLPTDNLTTQDKDIIESSKAKIVEGSTITQDVWEWNNSWQGNTFMSDQEKSQRCSAMSGSPNQDGFTILSSTPQDRIGGYNLTCHGTLHLIQKKGELSASTNPDLFPDYAGD